MTAVPDQAQASRPFGGTWDAWVRALSASLIELAPAAGRLTRAVRRRPFLCVITPVFDPALPSLERLVDALRRQTFHDFVHVMVSNGPSPAVAALVARVRAGNPPDPRFLYEELPLRETSDAISILRDLGRRRRHALGAHAADRYVFLDADVEILDDRYFARLYAAHVLSRRDLILTMVRYYDRVLPEFPIRYGHLDMANFTFSAAVAREHPYPVDHDPSMGIANDYRFWTRISAGRSPLVLDAICTRKDGHKSYERLTDRIIEEQILGRPGASLIPLFGNTFDQSDVDGVARVLESHLVGPGVRAAELEGHFARFLGFAHAVATSTATSGFWLLAHALELDGSTEVIVPNIHFHGVTNVLRLLGVPYRVADVGPTVPNLTPEAMAACLTPRTRAVVALDFGGWPTDVPGLRRALAAAGRDDVLLIGDVANSVFTRVDGRHWARSYDHAFLSFDMNKIVVTGDGGMVLTDDARLRERVRRLAYHGIEDEGTSGFERARRGGADGDRMWWEERIGEPGLNLLMNDVAASLGLTQVPKVEEFLAKRHAVREVYRERLAPLAEAAIVELPPASPSVSGDLYLFWLKLADRTTRDALARFLLARHVYTSVKYQPVDASATTPNAHDFWARALCLPLHQNLQPLFADYVMTQVAAFLAGAPRPTPETEGVR